MNNKLDDYDIAFEPYEKMGFKPFNSNKLRGLLFGIIGTIMIAYMSILLNMAVLTTSLLRCATVLLFLGILSLCAAIIFGVLGVIEDNLKKDKKISK